MARLLHRGCTETPPRARIELLQQMRDMPVDILQFLCPIVAVPPNGVLFPASTTKAMPRVSSFSRRQGRRVESRARARVPAANAQARRLFRGDGAYGPRPTQRRRSSRRGVQCNPHFRRQPRPGLRAIKQFALIQMNMGREVCRRLRSADDQLFALRMRCVATRTVDRLPTGDGGRLLGPCSSGSAQTA